MSSLTQCFASGLKHTSNNVIGLIGKSKQVKKVIPIIQEFCPSIKVRPDPDAGTGGGPFRTKASGWSGFR